MGSDLENTEYLQGLQSKMQKYAMLSTILGSMFLCGVTHSLQAPLYPTEAYSKGVMPSAYGFVFGAFEVASFLVSLPAGRLMVKLGPKCLMIFGLLLSGIALIVFGVLPWIDNNIIFFIVSIFCRLLEGGGTAFLTISTVSLLSFLLPDEAASFVTWTEYVFGSGVVVGPVIGGALYDAVGFCLPFTLTGCLLLALLPLAIFSLPSEKVLNVKDKSSNPSAWPLVAITDVCGSACIILFAVMMLGILNATLAMYLEVFNLIATFRGLIFLLQGVASVGSFPVWVFLLDKGLYYYICALVSVFLAFFGYMIIGPVSWLPLEPSLLLVVPAIFCIGVGVGGLISSSLLHMKNSFQNKNFRDNVSSTGMIAGVMMASVCLGGFFGPVVGGIMYEEIGFRYSLNFGLVQASLIATWIVARLCSAKAKSAKVAKMEKEKIDRNGLNGVNNNAYQEETIA